MMAESAVTKETANKILSARKRDEEQGIAKSFEELEDDEELYKGYRTRTFPGGKRVYAEGPYAGKEVGSVRGKGGMSKQALADKAQRKAEKKGIDSKAARKQIKEKTGKTSFDEGKHDAKREALSTARYEAGKKMDRSRDAYHDKLDYGKYQKHSFSGATGDAPKSKGHQERHEAVKEDHKAWLKAKIAETEHTASHPKHSPGPKHASDLSSLKQTLADYDDPKAAKIRDKNEAQIKAKTQLAHKEDKEAQTAKEAVMAHIHRKREKPPEGASEEERDAHFDKMKAEGDKKLKELQAVSQSHRKRIEDKVRAEHKPLTKSVEAHLEHVEALLGKKSQASSLEKSKKSGEGSRGGKIIGHTRTGKPIYDSHSHEKHSKFDKQDHADATAVHAYRAGLTEKGPKGIRPKHKGSMENGMKHESAAGEAEMAKLGGNVNSDEFFAHGKQLQEFAAKGGITDKAKYQDAYKAIGDLHRSQFTRGGAFDHMAQSGHDEAIKKIEGHLNSMIASTEGAVQDHVKEVKEKAISGYKAASKSYQAGNTGSADHHTKTIGTAGAQAYRDIQELGKHRYS